MKRLEEYGVESISIQECNIIVGGDFWGDLGYGIGYALGTALNIAGQIADHAFGVNPNKM